MAKASNTAPAKKAAPKKQNSSRSSAADPMMDLFYENLKDIYWAEKHLTKALPRMAKASSSPELKAAFTEHLEVTKNQITRLEEVFAALGKKAQAKKCDAMEGLVKEAESGIEETEKGTAVRDVALILSAQKVEHYEIAAYGGLSQLASTMQLEDVAGLLAETLAEEKEADVNLTVIAENNVNYEAAHEDEGSDEEE